MFSIVVSTCCNVSFRSAGFGLTLDLDGALWTVSEVSSRVPPFSILSASTMFARKLSTNSPVRLWKLNHINATKLGFVHGFHGECIYLCCLRHLLDVHPFRSRDLSADSKVMAIKYSMLKGSSHRHIAITDSILKACVCGTVEKDVNKWNLCKIYRRKIICQGIL